MPEYYIESRSLRICQTEKRHTGNGFPRSPSLEAVFIGTLQRAIVMTFSINCESCGQKLKATEALIGKRTKCPKCKAVIEIRAPEPEPEGPESSFGYEAADDDDFDFAAAAEEEKRAAPVSKPAPIPAPPRILPQESSRESSRASNRKFSAAVLAGVAIGSLILGYFIGREHLKYQMASAFRAAGEAFSAGMRDAFDPNKSPAKSAPASPAAAAPGASVVERPLEAKIFGMNEPFGTDAFQIVLQRASVEHISLKSVIDDDPFKSTEPALKITFQVRNTHDRKMLRFSENMFQPRFTLRDDVDNVVRGIDFGASTRPVEALSSQDDIPPGETRTHVEVFTVPLPKTEHLILTMDAKAFGGEGDVLFKIPAQSIQR